MQRLNFATIKKWSDQETKTNNENEIIKPLINNDNMTEKETKQLNAIEKMLNSIKDKLFPSKNLVIQDVNGIEIDFGDSVETSEQIQVGSTATVNGEPASGEYTLNDGTVYVFESGELTEIKEPVNEDSTEENVDTLKEEVENLKAENTELQNKLTASNAKVASLNDAANKIKNELTQELEKVQNEFNDFKNAFSDEKPDLNVPENNDNNGGKKTTFSYKPKNK
jgi:predicted nuclease with TOPRIM domain